MMLFPKALFLSTTLPKIDKNSIFLLNFHQNFQNFLQISKQFVVFVQTRQKLTQGFEISLKNRQKYCIFEICLRDLLKIFENFTKFPNNLCFSSKRAKNLRVVG